MRRKLIFSLILLVAVFSTHCILDYVRYKSINWIGNVIESLFFVILCAFLSWLFNSKKIINK
ncbi:membrane glycosyltransferase [Neobacillus drentensis]|nr:membrane glycosyltransferase [Neobacillus drentensis]